MAHAATAGTRWSDDAFLDALRDLSDPLADKCARDLPRDQSLAFLFTKMRTDADIPAELPEAFAEFLRSARASLELDDLTPEEQAKLQRGQQVFMRNAFPSALVLLAKSLQEGYQAPRLGKVLMMSGELEKSTYRRVLGVLQMFLQVTTPGSFEPKLKSDVLPSSDAGLTAIKVRLLHAGLRGIAKRKFPEFTRQFGGEPISLEDLLATLIALSSLVMDGFDILRIKLSDEDAEAYHFVWRVFARTMGIHPPGDQKSWAFVPGTLVEAREFYASYCRRHYRDSAENEEGVLLARANLHMLAVRMPPLAAHIYMHRLIGNEACKRLGIRPVPLMFVTKFILYNFPRAWVGLWRILDRRKGGVTRHDNLTQMLLQKLIVLQYDAGVPSYRVPRDMEEIREVVKGTQPGLTFGRDQFLSTVFPAELGDIAARRAAVGFDASRLKGPPCADQGLVGLALSGGGIRSATFALGVVQALARRGCLKMVDYLSTVSGGGYTGSALSSLLNDRDAGLQGRAFPLDYEPGSVEPPALRHLRNGSNYLAGGGLLSEVRLPTILLRGLLLNMLLVLPYIMLAALVTFLLFPLAHETHATVIAFWVTLLVFLTLATSYPAATWLWGRHRTWAQRNHAENRLAISLLVFVTTVLISIMSRPIVNAITMDWTAAHAWLTKELSHPAEFGDAWKWVVIAVVGYAAVRAGKIASSLTKPASRLFLYFVGLVGPAVVFGTYLLLLLLFARSPYLPPERERDLIAASASPPQPIDSGSVLRAELHARGVVLENPRAYISFNASDSSWTVHDESRMYRIAHHMGFLKLHGVGFGAEPKDWWFAGAALLLFALNALWVDVNITSPHGFWRDRLSRVFLFRARWFGKPTPNDRLKLSELGTVNAAVPYHLVNTSLNLTGSRVEDLPGRGSDFFMFSRRYVGSYATGYCDTTAIEKADSHLDLGTAMAISAAATAPNSGTTTIKPLVFILTLLNVRLDYWIPNPWYVQASSLVRRLMARVQPGPWYLLREAMGQLHARGAFVNLSDGGHIENLAVYELLRRRCKLIVAVDAEEDQEMWCAGLAKLIRYARIDLGIEINIDLSAMLPDANGLAPRHWAIGTIRYGNTETGQLVYVKSSVTGDEAPYVIDYRRRNPMFPQESTADQFFNEAQFESYRALGYHAMNGALKAAAGLDTSGGGGGGAPELSAVRDALDLGAARFTGRQQAIV